MLKKSSIDKLTALLVLPTSGQEQDWEVELADENRIGEFLMAYEGLPLSPDDKFALMALILVSADHYVEAKSRVPEEWNRIAKILIDERALHQETTSYWRCIDEDDPRAWFCLTPYVRALDTSR